MKERPAKEAVERRTSSRFILTILDYSRLLSVNWYKLLSIDVGGDSVSMEYDVSFMVQYEILAEAENTVEHRAYNSTECIVFEVGDQAELVISEDVTWYSHAETLQQTR